MHPFRHPLILSLAIVVLAPSAVARQDERGPDDDPLRDRPELLQSPDTAPRPLQFRLRAGGSHTFRADLEDEGHVSISRAATGLSLRAPITDRIELGLGVDTEYSHYDFGGFDLAGSSDPFDDFLTVGFSPTIAYQMSEQWSVFGGPRIAYAGESGADSSDAYRFGGFAGVRYQASEAAWFSLALGVFERFEDDALVIPFPGFSWRIDERTRLFTEADSVGPGVALERRLTEDVVVSLFARFEPRDFRLASDSVLPGGVLQDDRVTLGAFAKWTPAQNVELDFAVGGVVYQEFEIIDDDGDTIDDIETDPALQIGLRLRVRF